MPSLRRTSNLQVSLSLPSRKSIRSPTEYYSQSHSSPTSTSIPPTKKRRRAGEFGTVASIGNSNKNKKKNDNNDTHNECPVVMVPSRMEPFGQTSSQGRGRDESLSTTTSMNLSYTSGSEPDLAALSTTSAGTATATATPSVDEESKLHSVNRLLRRLQQNQDTPIAEDASGSGFGGDAFLSAVTNATKHASQNQASLASAASSASSAAASTTADAGIYVVANRAMKQGTMILSCEPECFVLETAQDRRQYCSYCCRPKKPESGSSSSLMFCLHCLDCNGNPMVGYCSDCTHLHKRHHIDNPTECRVIQVLRDSITPAHHLPPTPNTTKKEAPSSSSSSPASSSSSPQSKPSEPQTNTTNEETPATDHDAQAATAMTNHCLGEIFKNSVALLAIKLLSRKYERKPTSNTPSDPWWWKDLKLLYEHPLPSHSPYQAMNSLLAAALDAVVEYPSSTNPEAATTPSTTMSHEGLVHSIVGKILGCSHAIVDPSLPLGRQTLGRAIYAGHSFYNHACAPNAYLSTVLPVENFANMNDAFLPQSVTARVHLLRDIPAGEEITLSYLPLSGLSRGERREGLLQSYGFACRCSVCQDDHHPLVLPPQCTDPSEIDALREIQFGLNDKLLELSQLWKKDSIRKHNEQIRKRNFPEISESESDSDDDNETHNKKKDPAIVLQLDRVLRTIEMTQKGIGNQKLPECHEVSIETDRLLAKACDLWLEALGESLCVSTESAFEAHLEFWRKTDLIKGLFDPVALGTQCLASSVSCILRSQQQKSKTSKKQGGSQDEEDDENEHEDETHENLTLGGLKIDTDASSHDGAGDNEEEEENEDIRLSRSERARGFEILQTCLGRDHPWVQTLHHEPQPAEAGLLSASNHSRDHKRRRVSFRFDGIPTSSNSNRGTRSSDRFSFGGDTTATAPRRFP